MPAQPSPTGTKTKKSVTFHLDDPTASSVILTGTFCDWSVDKYPMKKDAKGVWKKAVSLVPGRYEYRFIVDGRWTNDPHCGETISNDFGSSNCVFRIE